MSFPQPRCQMCMISKPRMISANPSRKESAGAMFQGSPTSGQSAYRLVKQVARSSPLHVPQRKQNNLTSMEGFAFEANSYWRNTHRAYHRAKVLSASTCRFLRGSMPDQVEGLPEEFPITCTCQFKIHRALLRFWNTAAKHLKTRFIHLRSLSLM